MSMWRYELGPELLGYMGVYGQYRGSLRLPGVPGGQAAAHPCSAPRFALFFGNGKLGAVTRAK